MSIDYRLQSIDDYKEFTEVITCEQVQVLTGFNLRTIRLLLQDSDFPKPIAVSYTDGHSNHWVRDEIFNWMHSRPFKWLIEIWEKQK